MMMYRKAQAKAQIAQAEIERCSTREQISEPNGGGLTPAEFFAAVMEIKEESPIVGTLKIQK